MPIERIPTVRISPDNATVLSQLGLLKDLAGNWHGHGFNLVARPAFGFGPNVNLFLELNLTDETLKFDPISSSIPNRGVFQDDIELFGLTYLQKISDATTGGALHIEPGIWVTQPATTQPPESPPVGGQIVARMGSIPHGNALLAGGAATSFSAPPTIGAPTGSGNPAFSIFPSFNSSPFTVPPPTIIRAAGTSEFASIATGGFSQYTLTNAASATNPRTPFGNTPAVPLPANILGVSMQAVVNDPILLLQQVIKNQVADGHTFEGTVLNIATVSSIEFATTAPPPATTPPTANVPLGPTVTVTVADAAGRRREPSVPANQRGHCAGLRNLLDREGHAQEWPALHAASIRADGPFELPGKWDTLNGSAACFGSREAKFQLAPCFGRNTPKDFWLN